MAGAETPTEIVIRMIEEGKSDAEIVALLTEEGLKPAQISEALNQARIKQAVEAKATEEAKLASKEAKAREMEEGLAPSVFTAKEEAEEAEEVPMPGMEIKEEIVERGIPARAAYPYEYEAEAAPTTAIDTEAIEEIAEEIVSEKWEEARAKISSIIEWKEYIESRLKNMDERMRRIESALDKMQAALLGEVDRYGKTIKDLGVEMHSLEGAFSKILLPLVTNIKELKRITGKFKEGKGKEGGQQTKQIKQVGKEKKRK